MLKVNVFLGQTNNSSNGFWILLPKSEELLETEINSFVKRYGEDYILSDTEKRGYTNVLRIDEHDNLVNLNRLLNSLSEMSEDEIKLYLTAYVYFDQNEEVTKKCIEERRYEYFTDIEDEETLGNKIIEAKLIGYVPDRLKSYMDANKVATDWICNGTRIYKSLNTAFRQISGNELAKKAKTKDRKVR